MINIAGLLARRSPMPTPFAPRIILSQNARTDLQALARAHSTPQSLDIIANKFLRLPAVNSKIVQSTGDLHHKIVILFFRISENVFDNATSFDPSNDMLNHNPDT